AGGAAWGSIRGGVLAPEARDLCAGARWREEAVRRAQLEWRTAAVHRHRSARARHPGGGRAAATAILLRLGHSHGVEQGTSLQPDVLSQRIDLAARQCAHRARI